MDSTTLLKQLQSDMRLQRYFVTSDDLVCLQQIAPLVRPHLPKILEEFYIWVCDTDDYCHFFRDTPHMEHVKEQQLAHWNNFFDGKIDDHYFLSRRKIGDAHARIGMPLDVYFSGVMCFSSLFEKTFTQLSITDAQILHSFHKLLCMDTLVVVEAYSAVTKKELEERHLEFNVPVSQLWEGIIFLPLVGNINHKRASFIMKLVLDAIHRYQAKVFILDISGVKKMSNTTASDLVKITQATRLMGGTSILSGFSPEIAQTMVEMGLHTQQMRTTSTLVDALKVAFGLIRVKTIQEN